MLPRGATWRHVARTWQKIAAPADVSSRRGRIGCRHVSSADVSNADVAQSCADTWHADVIIFQKIFFSPFLPQPISFSYEVQWRYLDSRWIRLRARNFLVFFLKFLDFICKKEENDPLK